MTPSENLRPHMDPCSGPQPGGTPLLDIRPCETRAGIRHTFLLGAFAFAVTLAVILPVVLFAKSSSRLPALAEVQGVALTDSTPVNHRARRLAVFGQEEASPDARFIANWVVDSLDNRGMSFVIVDKKNARVFVFAAGGKLLGAAPVLLGAMPGDDSVPGIGNRPVAEVRPEERTTPAGRFVGEPGRNAGGEEVVWVDYDAAVSMHRVRIVDPSQRRLERLATPSTDDNRISFGCINVPVAFFETVLSPEFNAKNGVVYVLPHTKSIREVFPAAYDPSSQSGVAKVAAVTPQM